MTLALETPQSSGLFTFPNPVNETSARLVAAGVVAQSILFLVVREWWVLVPLTYGFVARVLTGPSLSPWGTIVTRVITPRITRQHAYVPGPPKRFAQGIGAVFTLGASLAWALGSSTVAYVLIAGLTVAASLEAFVGFCLGCVIFARLMRWGLIPTTVCEECNDISKRLVRPTA
ncbi:MAG: DUF4395 domain-containing protein [Acidimicrobiia bacterium]